jgi:ribosomal-protein-serine acetyltransferase
MDFTIKIDEQLSLKLRGPKDADSFFILVDKNREAFRQYLYWVDNTNTPADVEKFIQDCKEKFENKKGADFGVLYEGKWIGSMGFHEIDNINNKAAIGYWLDKDFQGKGIMTKCVQTIIQYGFEELGLNRIEILCEVTNIKSKAIPERLNFTFEGTLRANHKINAIFHDDLLFSLLKCEYKH